MGPFGVAGLTAGASLLGGALANRARRQEAQRNRDFQAQQSGTAHQREILDLRAAGLNPILSGMGGAGAATSAGSLAQQEDILTPAVSSALDTRRNMAEVANMEKQNRLIEEQSDKTRAEQNVLSTQYNINLELYTKVHEEIKLLKEQTNSAGSIARIAKNEAETSDLEQSVVQTKGEELRRLIQRWRESILGGGNPYRSLPKSPTTIKKGK